MMRPWASWSDDQVKLAGGMSAGGISNVVGIPLDRFRITVAQDAVFARPLPGHLSDTMRSLGSAYTGGVARVAMKGTASTLNLFIPPELREYGPFTASFVTGFVSSPVLNVPRMLQMAKINGESYPSAAQRLFTTGAGLRTYLGNTAMFAPGEALRMTLCFGTKDFLTPYMRRTGSAASEGEVFGRAASLAVTTGPVVAVIESVASLASETASTVHAKLGAVSQGGDAAAMRAEALGAVANPRYIARCFTSLCMKNMVANTATFFFMFLADEYTQYARALDVSHRRTTFEEMIGGEHTPEGVPAMGARLVKRLSKRLSFHGED
jgi:hypothetical protein